MPPLRTPNQIDPSWNPPEKFDEYRLLCPLSVGGMGKVYLGHDTLLDRPVAIKFLHTLGNDDSGAAIREQILNEARAAARLQHPNVVTIYRVSEIDAHPMIISEFVRGQNLDNTEKPMPWQRVLEIGLGIARGLGAAHRRGVLHLDIKPGNVIVQSDGEVKLLDFGLAKLLDLGVGIPGGAPNSDEIRRSSAATPEVVAPTMEFSGEQAAMLLESAPLQTLARGIAIDERSLAGEGKAKVTLNPTQPRFPDMRSDAPMPAPSTRAVPRSAEQSGERSDENAKQALGDKALLQALENSADLLPVAGGSSDSGSVTAELPRLQLAPTPPMGSKPAINNLLSGIEWALPQSSIANRIAGTPLYMAPETWRGEPGTRRADIYATGVLLYELATGSPPFHSVSLQELPQIVNQRDATPLYSVAPNVDPRLAAVIDRCLYRDPALRFGSGDELREALEQLRPGQKTEALPEGNPYRGLLAFEAEHRALFFGRKSEMGTILERLRTDPFVLVVADSGIGKSSLCRAGVLPHVTEGGLGGGRTWAVRSMIPGKRPLAALCGELAHLTGLSEEDLAKRLRNDPSDLGRLMHRTMGGDRGVVLFIDQLEEIVTIGAEDEAQVVAAALGYLCSRIPSVRMLMTVRSDFLARVAALPGLGDELARGLYLLRPLMPEKIKEAITGPAATKGVHFETEELVDALANETARTDGGLPLLQFALTELWEARRGDAITQSALDEIGGVSGALARHADSVMLSMPEEQRKEARRILMALVTVEGTRARRSDDELVRTPAARQALDALVRARLLVARDTGEGVSYEVAHEALLKGWAALRKWLDEHRESRAARQRLEAAAAEWQRLSKHRDVLWGPKQLAEAAVLEAVDIGPREEQFLEASRRALQRKQQLRRALALLAPAVLALLYGTYQVKQRQDLRHRVDREVSDAVAVLEKARRLNAEIEALRKQSFSEFDSQKRDQGEANWSLTQEKSIEVDELFATSSQMLEAALTLDGARLDIKAQLSDVLYERATVAERDHNPSRLRDLLARMKLYDAAGVRQKRWNAAAMVELETTPPGASVTVARYQYKNRKQLELVDERTVGMTPLQQLALAPGSYLLTLRMAGHATVRYPLLTKRDERLPIKINLPEEKQIPASFVYIPPGRFLFGTLLDDNTRKGFLETVPIHEYTTPGYLISTYEVTYADWIAYIQDLPEAEKEKRIQRAEQAGFGGTINLKQLPNNQWQLVLRQGNVTYTVMSGESISYLKRTHRILQDWRRLPVGGILHEDAEAYASWLNQTGRVRGARLCTEFEWERAARGADAREFPHGDFLAPDDANFDETYGKDPVQAGLDEVGSHPISVSPFGLHDMAGNVLEWVRSSVDATQTVARSGGFWVNAMTSHSTNRAALGATFRDATIGTRICAAWPVPSPG